MLTCVNNRLEKVSYRSFTVHEEKRFVVVVIIIIITVAFLGGEGKKKVRVIRHVIHSLHREGALSIPPTERERGTSKG